MDLAKALGILGFNSTRWLDMSSGLSPKQELDKAHFEKMMNIMKKKKIVIIINGSNERSKLNFISYFQEEDKEKKANKKQSIEKEKSNGDKSEESKPTKEDVRSKYNFKRKALTPDDEIRILHEAYQFLLKKYKLGEDPKAAAALVSPFMKLEMEEKPVVIKEKKKSSASAEHEEEELENTEYQKELDKDFDDNVFALEKAADEALPAGTTPKKGSIKRKKSSNASLKGEKTPVRKKSFRRDKSQSMKN